VHTYVTTKCLKIWKVDKIWTRSKCCQCSTLPGKDYYRFQKSRLRSILGHRSCSNRWARTESRFVRSSSDVFYLSRWDVVEPGKCRVITSRRRKRAVFKLGDEDWTKNGVNGSSDWRMRFATKSGTLVFGEVILLTIASVQRGYHLEPSLICCIG